MLHEIYKWDDLFTNTTPLTGYIAYWNDETAAVEHYKGTQKFRVPRNYTVDEVVGIISDFKYCGAGPNNKEPLNPATTLTQFIGIAEPPFFQKLVTADSSSCGISVCDLRIKLPIETFAESEVGAKDGKAIVIAESSAGDIQFAMNSDTYTKENIFENLGAGTYTIFARDLKGCTTQASFTIEGPIPYGLRYYFCWFDKYGSFSELNIYKRGYTGEVERLDVAGRSPLVISMAVKGDEIKGPILATEARIHFRSQKNYKFLELFTSDDREIKVEHIKDGILSWRGFLYSDVYGEEYKQPPYDVRVSASDNLASLQKMPFLMPGEQKYTGSMSAMQIIVECLRYVYLDLDIYTAVNTYEETMVTGPEYDPLTQVFVNADIFYASETDNDGKVKEIVPSCWDVLSKILIATRTTLRQVRGAWEIVEWDLREVPKIWIGLDPICEDDGQPEQRAKIWIGIESTCELDSDMANTGKVIFQKLREVYADTQEWTGTPDKPNVNTDTDYIPGVENYEACPVPAKCSIMSLAYTLNPADINGYLTVKLTVTNDPNWPNDPNIEWSIDGVNWQPKDLYNPWEKTFSVRPGETYKGRCRQAFKKQCIVFTEDFTVPMPENGKITFDRTCARVAQIQTLVLGQASFSQPIATNDLVDDVPTRLNVELVFRAYPKLEYQRDINDPSKPVTTSGGWLGASATTPAVMTVTNTRTGEVKTAQATRFDAEISLFTVATNAADVFVVTIT